MFRFSTLFALLLVLPLAGGCAGDSSSKTEDAKTETKTADAKTDAKTEDAKTEAAQAEPAKSEAKVYDVACGCSIEAVGHCGEYAMVGGRHILIKNHGLGGMPFCGQTGVKAKIAGEMKGEELHATSVEVVK